MVILSTCKLHHIVEKETECLRGAQGDIFGLLILMRGLHLL